MGFIYDMCAVVDFVDFNRILRSRPSASGDLENNSVFSCDPRSTVPAIDHPCFFRTENFHPLFFRPVEMVFKKTLFFMEGACFELGVENKHEVLELKEASVVGSSGQGFVISSI